jgi:hypothetical protein
MNEFLQSIKSDLLSRRLLPFVALVGVALIAAVAYAVTGGSGSTAPASVASTPNTPAVSGVSVLPVAVAPTNPNQAVSETPSGGRFQSHSPTRDPFIPLPSPAAASNAASAGAGSGSSTGSSTGKSTGSGSAGSSSGGSGSSKGGAGTEGQKTPAPVPKKPTKPSFPYDVSALFGLASTTPGQPTTLAPYENLKLDQPLPSKQDLRISFERVTTDGKGAVFKLVVPPILHGSGVCLPSTSECQTIDLETGHSEELEYVEADGQVVLYELKIVSIVKKGSGASAARARHNAKAALSRGNATAAQAIGSASIVVWHDAASATQG